ncbi:hypothetical protein DYBT9275_04250 [Dyadobacter sp. CECT 9275]|uniref:EamA domain-containing protein n=1 Tax=Dyadobacter helix TaxID=2822344 RepID=A0A916JEX1_9BACT|nr:EamA family transporter [Dyadobacter sp. CECT 9275]CAG5008363.1 hypothetical protein DYBT9275_04250 [Dyadobacter sp. CECT 9275]
MSFYVLSLVLTAAVLHAGWNLLSKKTQGRTPFIWLVYTASSVVYLPILLFTVSKETTIWSLPILWFSLASSVLHLGYYIILQKGYRSADLSVVYPLARGSGPLFSSLAAILFLNELLKIPTTIGLCLIIAGVLLIAGLSFKRKVKKETIPGVTYGVLTGLFIALYTINDTIAVKFYGLPPLTLTFGTNLLSSVLLFPVLLLKKDEVKREIRLHKGIIIAIAVLSPAAYILILEALKYAPLTVVAPARESSIVLGVWMGSRVFNEEDGRRRLIASLLILCGIIALGLS